MTNRTSRESRVRFVDRNWCNNKGDIIAGILKYAPHVRCFAIGSADLAKQHSEHASRKFPGPKRKQIAKNAYNRWTRLVKSVIDDVKTTSYETIVERLRSLPFSAMELAFDAESAEKMIDKYGR